MLNLPSIVVLWAICLQISPGAGAESGGDAESDADKSQQRKWNAFYQEQAAGYDITLDGDPDKRLELVPDSALHWSNPLRFGETNGSVFVWTHAGQVELVGTVFSHLSRIDPDIRHVAHSFHSLSLERMQGSHDGNAVWSFPRAGIEPRPIPAAPKPAASETHRLTQMRQLAREFTATVDLDGEQHELRLLPQPLYRNQKSSEAVLDGALFTFVIGTDPELMLLIQARQTENGYRWHYSTGRFSDLTITFHHRETLLWVERSSNQRSDPNYPYLSWRPGTRARIIE